jgi:hypothetical protein
MGNNLHLLNSLREKLINADNFSDVMHYFFDHFAENEEFLQLGRPQHSNLVETIAVETATAALQERATLRNFRLIRLPKEKFYHGACFVNGRIANIFFFEDIMTGMMAISMEDGSSEVRFARMTGIPVKNPKAGKWN